MTKNETRHCREVVSRRSDWLGAGGGRSAAKGKNKTCHLSKKRCRSHYARCTGWRMALVELTFAAVERERRDVAPSQPLRPSLLRHSRQSRFGAKRLARWTCAKHLKRQKSNMLSACEALWEPFYEARSFETVGGRRFTGGWYVG